MFKTLNPTTYSLLCLLAGFSLLSGCLSFDNGDDDDSSVSDDDDTAAGDDDDSSVSDDDDSSVSDDDDTATGDDDDTATGDDDDSGPAVVDQDGDGVPADEDCDDNDSGSTVVAEDADCDGVLTAADSDDTLDTSTVVAEDADCDGVLTAADCDDTLDTSTVVADDADCDGVLTTADCDDSSATVYPGAAELCNGVDDDCDPATAAVGGETDVDSDSSLSCVDCDDNDVDIFPGAAEQCDGIDNDCVGGADFVSTLDDGGTEVDTDTDGSLDCADCEDTNASNFPGNSEVCDGADNDCNAGADYSATPGVGGGDDGGDELSDSDSDSVLDCADCDDNAPTNYPGNAEVCDGQDNDCTGGADFFAVANGPAGDGGSETADADNDTSLDCADCDDNDANNYPGNSEVCDGADNDCVGGADFVTVSDDGGGESHSDNDNVLDCDDCNDADAFVYPNAPELCDGVDNDCDGSVAAQSSSLTTTLSTNSGHFGNVFDLNALQSVDIVSLDINVSGSGSGTLDVYWKMGSGYSGNLGSASWTQVAGTPAGGIPFTVAGTGQPTSVILPSPISLMAGQTYSIHVLSSRTLNYRMGTTQGAVYAQDTALEITEGLGCSIAFNCAFSPRIWSGTVFYDTQGELDADTDSYLACAECNDSADTASPGLVESMFLRGGSNCGDGLDNDCDGFIDGADSGCQIVLPPVIGGGGGPLGN